MNFDGSVIAMMAVGGGVAIAIVSVVGGLIQKTLETRSRERTRREVAAYVAEGSMSAEEGERLLQAGPGAGKGRCGS